MSTAQTQPQATNNVANEGTLPTVGSAEMTKHTLFASLSKSDKEKLRCAYESDRVTLPMFLYAVRITACMAEIKDLKRDIKEKAKYLGAETATGFACINSPSNLPAGVLDFTVKETDGSKTLYSPYPLGKESSRFQKLAESANEVLQDLSANVKRLK